jgi:hypothetical protein
MIKSMSEIKSEQQEITLLNKSINLFTKPSAVFTNIKDRSDWWFPFTIIVIATIISSLSTVDIQVRAQRDFINTSEIIPESKKVEMLDAMDNQGVLNKQVVPAIGGVLSVGVSYLVIAGSLIFFGNFIYGGQASFKHIFTLVSWGGLIGLPELIIKLPIMLVNRTLHAATSPAIFLSGSESKTLVYNVLDVFDVFTIWKIVVFSIGLAIIYNFSMKKSYTAVIVLYVVYAGISISLSQLFKGVML